MFIYHCIAAECANENFLENLNYFLIFHEIMTPGGVLFIMWPAATLLTLPVCLSVSIRCSWLKNKKM